MNWIEWFENRVELNRVNWNYRKYFPLFSIDNEWAHQWQLVDRDGTLTGAAPGSKVVSYSPLYDPELCIDSTRFSKGVRAQLCSPEAKFARIAYNKAVPYETLYQARIEVENPYGTEIIDFVNQASTNSKGWFMILPTGVINKISYPDFPAITDIGYSNNVMDIEVRLFNLIIWKRVVCLSPLLNNINKEETFLPDFLEILKRPLQTF